MSQICAERHAFLAPETEEETERRREKGERKILGTIEQMNRTLWRMMTDLVGWAYPVRPQPKSETLHDEWCWVLSTAEEICQKQSDLQRTQIHSEVQSLKRVSHAVHHRKAINDAVIAHWASLDLAVAEMLAGKPLDASKRDRIVRDALRQVAGRWLSALDSDFPLSEEFRRHWYQEKYKKNVVGQMAAFAFTASNAGVLTDLVARDIVWSVYLCLSKSLSDDLSRELDPEEQKRTLDLVLQLLPIVVILWATTARNVGDVEQRAGLLPDRWQQKEREERDRLASLKASRMVDARYEDGPADALRRSCMSKSALPIPESAKPVTSVPTSRSVKDVRASLAQSLVMRRPKP